jgi:ribose 5-phosphate isomerase B
MKPTIYVATDHAGFELKNALAQFVTTELGYTVIDCGAYEYVSDDDYPELIASAIKKLQADPAGRAIILGGSGQGEAMVANRFKGVRATVYYGGATEILTLSREHNDANVLSLGARFLSTEEAKEAVRMWLQGTFSGDERHSRRIKKIDLIV